MQKKQKKQKKQRFPIYGSPESRVPMVPPLSNEIRLRLQPTKDKKNADWCRILLILETARTFCACHTKRLCTRYMKHVGMSQSATPATRNRDTQHLKPPRVTTFAELARGTATRSSRRRLRTVADGCARMRSLWLRQSQPQPPNIPNPQSETGTLATHSGKTPSSDSLSHRSGAHWPLLHRTWGPHGKQSGQGHVI